MLNKIFGIFVGVCFFLAGLGWFAMSLLFGVAIVKWCINEIVSGVSWLFTFLV